MNRKELGWVQADTHLPCVLSTIGQGAEHVRAQEVPGLHWRHVPSSLQVAQLAIVQVEQRPLLVLGY